ncbi:JmjC domain-containing protein 1 [Taphrina deformans PYCC 5710]|uniref:JmjC domain-containing protein 1 n=1 Tax=Taphrina deformans (strain PYCC 5710 / ATCC 11124 / CBS 356.35 / IMI 108563 / JCM 9778 / NBRC 8474) TaxID=1097556 RepID=R4XCL8_TAPDE|nr:JmjC domain-containing protein 1 [Taphrina deformans PYCC 5710]|eukprot:CCG83363.1 JmjC domain-containing protein 1 [Taphrina deformans PYCC 5710]
MSFSDFLDGMEAGQQNYARDIHVMKHFPQNDIYSCPPLFRDDWLNFKLDAEGNDDYKFVYIGGDGTRTKLHKDVVASHSWSSNLTGTKEWTLIPPAEASHLFTFDHDEVVSDINLDDAITRARWPNLRRVRDAALVVLQHPGETIFVPSPTLSINHNWINAVSLHAIFENLVIEETMSADAVMDLKQDGIVDDAGFVQVVQELTFANAGMNWDTFFDLILFRFEHEDSYIPAQLRPTPEYERMVVLDVCQKWSNLEDAQHLPNVAQKVSRIKELLEES